MSKIQDLKYHGGQSWATCENFLEDFSVTTNALGTPQSGKEAVIQALEHMQHYPPSSQEPALSETADYFWPTETSEEAESSKNRMLLGNGSSEVIDLAIRFAKRNGATSFRPGPTLVQYKDYERCALAAGLTIHEKDDRNTSLTSMVNPTNPTGNFMRLEEIKAYISSTVADNSFVTVDESMIFWYGPDWRSQSLTSQTSWIEDMRLTRGIRIFIIHSWTKIWSCCGIRIGSIIAPTEAIGDELRAMQTPWSVNVMALAFLSAALKDEGYMRRTWEFTKLWRASFVEELETIFPAWKISGAPFTSWIWVDTGSASTAKVVHDVCESYGVPIRWAKHGYKEPTCIRFGVRKPEYHQRMFEALRTARRVLSGDEDAEDWAHVWLVE